MAENLVVGEIGETRVLAKLLELGHIPYRPVVDDHGVDFMLSTGLKLQVKTARLTKRAHQNHMTYSYTLGIVNTTRNRRGRVLRRKLYSEECDVLILHGLDENRFWICPAYLVDGRACLELGPRSWRTAGEVREQLDLGIGVLQTAAELQISRTTVWRRKHGDIAKGGFVRAVRLCEDKWEFLISARETSKSADGASTVPAYEEVSH